MQDNNAIIEFRGVSKEFTSKGGVTRVLDNLNFVIEKNSFTIIYGPSGSGKTTILNMLLGLLPPTAGKVFSNGVDLYKLDNNQRALFRAQNYGVIGQNNNWVNSLNTLENIALPLFLKGETYSEGIKKAKESLEKIGLQGFSLYHPGVMSVGQQQRVSVARATVETPMFIVADEPTGSLDSKNGDLIMKIITKFKNEHNSTIILVTHNMDYLTLSDHRIFLKDGAIEQYSGGYFEKSAEAERVSKGSIGSNNSL